MSRLDALLLLDSDHHLCVWETLPGVLIALTNHSTVQQLRTSVASQAVSADEIKAFVEKATQHFKKGVAIRHQYALGGLAVVLMSDRSEVATSYIEKLASARVMELQLAQRIAHAVVRERSRSAVMRREYRSLGARPSRGIRTHTIAFVPRPLVLDGAVDTQGVTYATA